MSNIDNNESSSNEMTGKKIFFLYPTASVQSHVIAELVQHEYEVYIAKDHNRLARILKKYPDSIIYINIDEMNEAEYEKWITSLLTALPSVKIGVFTSNTDEEFKNRLTSKFNISCGLLTLKIDMSKMNEKINAALNILNVKGRRKYIRASTERESNTTMNMPFHGEYLNGTIKDISVVGISCVFENDPDLSKNTLLKDIQIRLQSILLKVEGVIFGSRESCGEKTYVMLFTQRIDPDVKVKIRKYIQQNLQAKMDNEIN
jgi:hypothetical protein